MCMLIAKRNKLIIRKLFLSILILAIHLEEWDEYK